MDQVEPVHVDSEDSLKRALALHLEREGWEVVVSYGHVHGIDVEGRKGPLRWVIEAKGPGSSRQAQGNNFLSVLGEIFQRVTDPETKYSIALPNLPSYARLWERLSRYARSRVGLTALFVGFNGEVTESP